jgi:hypothetical protein
MFTTSAPSPAAHSIPSMIEDISPLPNSSSTLPTSRSAPGATPRPSDASPEPSAIEATCVP